MTALALVAFAANSLFCRAALADGSIDAASFTSIRLIAGAAVLWLIVRTRAGSAIGKGNWLSALALFAYAAGFSFAYLELSTATGALLLFGAVQSTILVQRRAGLESQHGCKRAAQRTRNCSPGRRGAACRTP